MKSLVFLFLIIVHFTPARAQQRPLPAHYVRDSLPALTATCRDLLAHAYMAQKFIKVTDTLPGWEGYPVKLYAYQTGIDIYTGKQKTGLVYLLNPTPEKLAIWIATTCWIVKKSVDYRYTHQLFEWIKQQSGAQFPVKGIVYEDQYVKGFQEPYLFKDGVTVYIRDSTRWPADKTCTTDQLDFYLHATDSDLKEQTGQFARIGSAAREDYIAYGGKENVGDKEHRKLKWLDVVRRLYQKAWRSDRNDLLIMWAERHLQ